MSSDKLSMEDELAREIMEVGNDQNIDSDHALNFTNQNYPQDQLDDDSE